MYEHPIKRAGLSINRIIFSNTRMVMAGFPNLQAQQFNLSFKYRTYDQGKIVATKCKRYLSVLTPFPFRLHLRRFGRCPSIQKEGMSQSLLN